MFSNKIISIFASFINFMILWSSAQSYLIPYQLGNTVIMIDPQDFNVPRNREPSFSPDSALTAANVKNNIPLNNNHLATETEVITSYDFSEEDNEPENEGAFDDIRTAENFIKVGLQDENGQFQTENDITDTVKDIYFGESNDNEYTKDTVSVELKFANPKESEENEIQRNDDNKEANVKKYMDLKVRDQDKVRNFLYIPLPESLLKSIQRKQSEAKEQEKDLQPDMKTNIFLDKDKEERNSEEPTFEEKIPEDEETDNVVVKLSNEEREKIKSNIQFDKRIIPGRKGQPATTLFYFHSPDVKKDIKKNPLADLKLISETPAVQKNNIYDFLRLKAEWERANNAKQKNES